MRIDPLSFLGKAASDYCNDMQDAHRIALRLRRISLLPMDLCAEGTMYQWRWRWLGIRD
jgi:hypothetical protein